MAGDEPTAEVRHDEPTADVRADEPTAEVRHDEPTAEVRADEPTAEVRADEPAGDARPEEPTTEMPASDRWAADPTLQDTPVGGGSAAAEKEPTKREAGAAAPPRGGHRPPPPPPGAGAPPPPPPTSEDPSMAFTSRYGLVRPRQGRYVAGVCAAIGRATNTDPVLWRVLFAVLGFFGGIGILVYLAGWLVIPAEGDTASPVESMLGRGRSSMSPVMVIVLGVVVVLMFGLIVTDGFRAVVLGAAVLIGGALLLNRKPGRSAPAAPSGGEVPFGAGRPWQPAAPPYPYPYPPAAGPGRPAHSGPYPTTATFPAAPPPPRPSSAPPPVPPTPPVPPMQPPSPPSPPPMSPRPPHRSGPPFPPAPPMPPRGTYRPPFAPHGPYAGHGPYPPGYGAPPAVPPRPPKPPKERSPLGTATFSLIFVALGLVAMLDLTNLIHIKPSTYFFGVLVTVGLGLLVGTWFGRGRWLIALGFIAAAALGISTIAESQVGRYESSGSDVVWQPRAAQTMAERYEHNFGSAVLDLSKVDFTGQDETIMVHVSFGDLKVIVPPNVDTTVHAEVTAGDAHIFENKSGGIQASPGEITDLGPDGEGGGKLNITIKVNAGSAEVHR
ncbi:PspC domain-containing protein [Phytohabitans flavus]|uniref:PspC domain-containing protein n=1 Tax=Phytohabitans flavus TaxID=1076124 RepID=UPI003634353A